MARSRGPQRAPSSRPSTQTAHPVNSIDPIAQSPDASRQPASNRRFALATLIGLAALSAPAAAQMGGPGGGGGGGGPGGPPGGGSGCSKPPSEKTPDNSPPPDLMAAFALRLRQGVPELAIAPPQAEAYRQLVESLAEVGQHNQRRLQRIMWMTAASVSAASPLTSYIHNETEESSERQQALDDMNAAYDKVSALLDERQRAVLTAVFVATRSELQAQRPH